MALISTVTTLEMCALLLRNGQMVSMKNNDVPAIYAKRIGFIMKTLTSKSPYVEEFHLHENCRVTRWLIK